MWSTRATLIRLLELVVFLTKQDELHSLGELLKLCHSLQDTSFKSLRILSFIRLINPSFLHINSASVLVFKLFCFLFDFFLNGLQVNRTL